ncbi:unannotated protein [freshwater metagenome]|uniref:Unannotated protein n=1 Tax=freshwater metagenome TaxID=449393 RepID=A0A6J6NKQ2_9ZZZZ
MAILGAVSASKINSVELLASSPLLDRSAFDKAIRICLIAIASAPANGDCSNSLI